jgi:HEAT repeat protein
MNRTIAAFAGLTLLVVLASGCDSSDADKTDMADGAAKPRQPVNRGAIEADMRQSVEDSRLAESMRAAEESRPRRPQIPERWPQYREWSMREVSIDSLGRIGAAAIPALVDVLHDPDPLLRRHAAQALARIGPDARDAVPDLIVALQDRDEEVRKNVARALGQIGPEARAAVPALLEELKAAPSVESQR